ncbi:telomerase reverse transcriptase isoform X5 [Oryza glaberrima]|uniref:telomerase reverse transcriptase isoform X5 n=1 Tax=Oryza glaberrima TaxID=4538 RepID=UPI00224C080B|nr:telomerase reverse transcriptase isoform X5 [Oryza glaberrima]
MPRWRRRRVAPGGQVPPELRLAYGARALTLGRAVFSLLPSPRHRESPCPACRGRVASGCLACRRWEHLLRDGDPVAYRRLITRAVCAIAADDLSAPPPPRYTPGNSGHSQARLVREMMKSIVADQSHGTKNVLCNGLHEGGQSICISDLVSSSSWSILLHRIGDLLMCYLLRCTSIFLPVKKNDYFQVSGVPLNVVLRNPIFASTVARKHQPQTTKAKCHTVAPDVTKNDGKAHYSPGGKAAYYDRSFSRLEAYSTHQQVASFVWAVLKRIVPKPLLGNSFGKRSLRTNIWKFIKLRRFETFQLSDCIGDLKVSHYSWLSNIEFSNCFCSAIIGKQTGSSTSAEEQKQKNILHCWISWLFSDIVIPVVRTYFYVTERESKRYDVFYYPKSVWRDLTSNAIASLNKKNFRILRGEPRKAVRHLNCSSRVRFLPKAKDMRPLVNLRAKSKDANLNKCHLIMKKLRDEKPEMFGSSVFDYNNVHQNLSQFISSKRSQLMKKLKVYIVVADVSKAFDCVSHDMVLKMIDDAFKCDEYTVRKCSKVICNRSKNSLYRFDSNASIGNGNSIYDLSIQLSSGGGIFVDQGTICRILKEQFHHLLYEQIKCNILKIGQKYYLQQVGIAQGSKLSPNLCSLYYGHLENSVLSKFLHDSKLNAGEAFSEPEYLLMRFIDDFIFISFSLEHAQKFLNRMRRGFVFYNCYMNDSKYGFNFCAGNSEPSSNRLYRGDDGVSFMPWSGLLINCETLEIQADYTRYLDITIISTITVKMHSSTKYIHSKLCHYMRPKCHPIFYDSNINSPGTIRVNIYQAFLLCAMKFHCYIRSISDANVSKLELLQVIKRTFRYMHSLIVRRMQDVELHYNVRPVLKLRRKETIWLGLTAYIRVLQQKQSRYKDMLTLLTAELGRYCHLGHECDTLRYAVDDSHSSMFWKFKF